MPLNLLLLCCVVFSWCESSNTSLTGLLLPLPVPQYSRSDIALRFCDGLSSITGKENNSLYDRLFFQNCSFLYHLQRRWQNCYWIMYAVIMNLHTMFCLTGDRRLLHNSGRQTTNFGDPRYVKCTNQMIIWTVSTKLGRMVIAKIDALAAALIHTLIINLSDTGDLCRPTVTKKSNLCLALK